MFLKSCLLAGPMSSGVDVVPFAQRKDRTIATFVSSRWCADPVTFSKESMCIMRIYFIAHKTFLVFARIELRFPLETIYKANTLPLS